jgi:hypothetical protein
LIERRVKHVGADDQAAHGRVVDVVVVGSIAPAHLGDGVLLVVVGALTGLATLGGLVLVFLLAAARVGDFVRLLRRQLVGRGGLGARFAINVTCLPIISSGE